MFRDKQAVWFLLTTTIDQTSRNTWCMMEKSLFFFLFLLLVLGGECAPYATRPEGDNVQQNFPMNKFVQNTGFQIKFAVKYSRSLTEQHSSLSEDQENYRSSSSHRSISIAVPLICIFIVLLSLLFVLKFVYLKQRRIQTIHEMPSLLATLKDQDDRESILRDPYARVVDTLRSTDIRSIRSRISRSASKRSSAQSSAKNMDQNVQQDADTTPGVLVGLLGSPDWETGMQRQLANHQWRLRRESREAEKSQHRHTWHSQQSYAYSRYSTTHSRPGSIQRNRSMERSSRRNSGRRSSMRMSHLSSFGEMEMDTFREIRRRPKSLSAVVDQMNAGRGGTTPDRSPTSSLFRQQISNGTGGGSGFSASLNAHSQRPSTISEVSTPEHSNLSLRNEANFRFHVTDCSKGIPGTTSPTISLALNRLVAPKSSVESGLGSARMELSSTYEHLNTSGESSIGGSWGQLPNFPSPPATPISPAPATPQSPNEIAVNNVTIAPYYFNERFFDGRLHSKLSSNELLGNLGYGLGFSGKADDANPSSAKSDIEWATLSDPLMPDFSHHSIIYQRANTPFSQLPPMHYEDTDSSSQPNLPDPSARKTRNSVFLKPVAASLLNRHHSRVRSHVPFALVTPPPAYLKSPRSFERTVRFSLTTDDLGNINEEAVQSSNVHAASLIDLSASAPVRPSPLRRVATMGSIGSSRASTRNPERAREEASSILRESEANVECSVSNTTPDDSTRQSTAEVSLSDNPALKTKTSHASLFLDLGDPSCDAEEPSEFYSFDDTYDTGQEHGFSRSQAKSSGILDTNDAECLEDIDFIVGFHSESLIEARDGLDRIF